MFLTLPSGLRRAEIRSFYLVMSGILLITLSLAIGLASSSLYLIVAIMPFSLVGLLNPKRMTVPYRLWNKCAKVYGRFAQICLISICYYIIVSIVSLAGLSGGFASAGAASSRWMVRRPIPPSDYHSQSQTSDSVSPGAPWAAAFVSWAWESRNTWALCLLPFVMMVSLLDSDEAAVSVSEIYTLF